MENLLVSAIGLLAVGLAVALAWRGRRLSLVPAVSSSGIGASDAAVAALRSLGASVAAGLVAGVLVAGLGGRLVMRALAATSGDAAQGRATEAEEIVGEITVGGTLAFVLFVGIGAGLLAAFVHLLTRSALPRTAAPAGLVLGVILLGTIGILDPLSPDNVDFAILEPRWLAVVLIVATGLLLGVTYAAVVARFAAASAPRALLAISAAPIVLLLVPPVALVAVLYIAGHAVLRGRWGSVLARPSPLLTARVLLGVVVAATGTAVSAAAIDILV